MNEKALLIGGNVKKHVEAYSIKDSITTNYTKDWIRNVHVFIVSYKTYHGNDIRKLLLKRKGSK